MKSILALLFCLPFISAWSQQPQFRVDTVSLPDKIRYYNNQFSSLYIYGEKLFIMSESRLQDSAEAKLYAIKLTDLDRKRADTLYNLPFKKYTIYNLAILRNKMAAAGQQYEGLEAMVIHSGSVYFSVETTTPSSDCYLIKGALNDTAVLMDTSVLMPIPKPTTANGSHIYNAGFEALLKRKNQLYAFFEFNYFPSGNFVYALDSRLQNNSRIRSLPVNNLPFRITDITHTAGNHFTAINYFFNGEGDDTVYRTPDSDVANAKHIKDEKGYNSYCRLIDVAFKGDRFTWKPLWEFPQAYRGYNWEGIAAYKGGYFIINDKYTPRRPYRSTLLYLKKIK